MTKEEAIKEFESELKWAELNTYPYVSKQKIEADKMAINALEQQKKGHWITNSDFPDELICSCCNTNYDMWFWKQGSMKYCLNCGAKMESEDKE